MRSAIVRSALVTMAAVLALAGCGDDGPAKFTADSICGIPSSVVAGVLGTRRFEVGTDRRSTMPFDGSAALNNLDGHEASSSCSMLSASGRLLIQGEIVDAGDVEVQQNTLRRFDVTFDHAGGIGGVNDGTAGWACGQIRLLVKRSGDVDQSPAALQAATEAFADVAGCWSG